MWRAIVWLLGYLIAVIAVFDLIDWTCYIFGCNGPDFIDPAMLSIRQMQALLSVRGILPTAIYEKSDLIDILKSSGNIKHQDILHVNEESQRAQAAFEAAGSHEIFTGSLLQEKVEDCKDSAWLVQVRGFKMLSLFESQLWNELTSIVTLYGIRTGIFDCNADYKFCEDRSWNSSRLLFAVPYTNKAKSGVILHTYSGQYNLQNLKRWIFKQGASRVQILESTNALAEWIDESCLTTSGVCVLLISTLTLPPFFLSALGVKFSGRVRFGMCTQRTTSAILPLSQNIEEPVQSSNVGQYVILTAERNTTYGRRASERLNFRSFYAYLHLLVPDINDIFVFTLAVTNLLAITTIFEHSRMSIPRIILKFLFTVAKLNGALIILWIFVLGLLQFKAVIEMVNKLSSYWRLMCLNGIGFHFHVTLLRLTQAPVAFIATYLAYLGVSTAFLHRVYPEWFPQSENDNESWIDWLTSYGSQHRDLLRWHYMHSIGNPAMPLDATMDEERLLRLIAHLNSMNLFVQPAPVSPEFVHRLPTWTFGTDDGNAGEVQGLCVRCRCIKRLQMRKVAGKFAQEPCRKCGFNGEFNSEPNLPFQATDCPICLEAYQCGEIVCQLPCSHGFHKECIHGWLRRDQTQCPVCRWPAYKMKPKQI